MMMKRICCLLSLLLLPSCMLGIVDSNVSAAFEPNDRAYPARPASAKEDVPDSQWALARNEVLEFADAQGGIIYYAPIKVTLGYSKPPTFTYERYLWPLPFSESAGKLGADEDKQAMGEAVMYFPLIASPPPTVTSKPFSYTEHPKSAIALFTSPDKMTRETDFAPFLEGHPPASLQLIRKISAPNLKTQLYQHRFNPSACSLATASPSFFNRLGYGVTYGLVDVPLSIIGTITFSLYENTLGIPACLHRNFSQQESKRDEGE